MIGLLLYSCKEREVGKRKGNLSFLTSPISLSLLGARNIMADLLGRWQANSIYTIINSLLNTDLLFALIVLFAE